MFFDATARRDFHAVTSCFARLLETNGNGRTVADPHSEIWPPIRETVGAWELWDIWRRDASLLEMFYAPALAAMPEGSIYFGGTGHGRFAITALTATNPFPRVFTITQNALVDNVYAGYLRAIYGDRIWLPQNNDLALVFQRLVDEIQSGKRKTDAVTAKDGHTVQVNGDLGLMEINGIICEMIFENNRDGHAFFVEESYVLDWMYPFLEPCGVILRLHAQQLDTLPEETVARDHAFWDDLEKRLTANPGFAGNMAARNAFAKLRTAIAGIYTYRKRYDAAETAFAQARRLSPSLPETNIRFAEMYVQSGDTDRAIQTLESFLPLAPASIRDQITSKLHSLKQ